MTSPLVGQTTPAPGDDVVKMHEFVSLGSRFNDRTVADSAVPIDVISRAEINTGGYQDTSQVMQSLIPSFNFPRPSLTDGTDHIRPATLRGLAPDQTLVLINGKRRHTSSLVNLNGSVGRGSVSTDFNAIPSSAIERIEVLRDGASAQYGSDAIAGVIDVVLRKDKGWGYDISYGATKEGDGRDLKIDAFAGVTLGDKGSLFVTAFGSNHSPTNRIQPDTRQQYFGTNPATGALTTISGNYGSGTGLSPSNGTLDPRELTVNRFDHRFGDPRSKDKGIWFNGDYPLANGMDVYVFGGGTDKHGEGAGFFRRAGDDRTIRSIWPNGFLPVIQSDVTDLSLGAGVKGKAGSWDYDLSTVYGGNELAYTTANSINDTLGNASPTHFYDGKLVFSQSTTNLDLSNEFNIGLKSPLKVAAGGEFRYEKYKIGAGVGPSYVDNGIRVLDGPDAGMIGGSTPGAQVFPGFKQGDAGVHTRDAKAVYVDFEQNLTDQWLVSLAGRFEDYNDFGSKTTGKFATRYEIVPAFALRGSISTGFRAPHLAQEWFSSTATNFIGGIPFDVRTFPVSNPVAVALGASPLKPETSLNDSVGFTWQPLDGFTATFDYYNIKINDRIVLSSNFIGAPVTNFLTSQGLPALGGGRYFTNGVDTRTQGADLSLRYLWNLHQMGKVTLTAGANENQTRVTRFKPTPPQLAAIGITTPLFDLTEKTRMESAQPRNNVNLSIGYDIQKWSFLLRDIRYGEVKADQFASATPAQIAALTPGYNVSFAPTVPAGANSQIIQTFGAKWITDLDVTYRVSRQWSVSIGADNLFDIYPDQNLRSVVVNGVAYNGADNVGIFPYNGISPFGFNGAFYYSKISFTF